MRATERRDIPAQRYDFSEAEIATVLGRFERLLRSRSFLTLGDYVEQFESNFARVFGAPHAVAVASGTSALEAILRAVDVEDAEVVVPTNTFAATAFAVLHAGGRPVFADCGEDLCLDPADVERRLTDRTKAVVVVHVGGLVSPAVPALQELCRERGIALVEDAAQAHGSRLEGRHAGSFGVAAAFSFFTTKVMTTGEGGMVVTGREQIAERIRVLRDQGKVGGRNVHEVVGHNWRMTELQAILGLAQLDRVEGFVLERRRIAALYDEVLAGSDSALRPLTVPPGSEPNYYKYIVFVEGVDVPAVSKRLRDEFGVRLGGFVYEVPCHMQPVFAELSGGPLPRAERLSRRHLCPPIYPSLGDDDARYVGSALRQVVS